MKLLSFVLLLMWGVACLLCGCSDNSTQPVSPASQSVPGSGALAKGVTTEYTFTDQPIAPPVGDPPTLCGGVWQVKNHHLVETFVASDPYMAGIMEHNMSSTYDAVTGEGPIHGSWKITPSNMELTGGGWWEGTYEGYRSGPNPDGTWTAIAKALGRGVGGTIDGWKTASTITLTVYHYHPGIPEDQAPPYPLSTSWRGEGTGYYIQR